MSQPRYLKKVLEAAQPGSGVVAIAHVIHEDHCAVFLSGRLDCTCDPDVKTHPATEHCKWCDEISL